MKRLCLNVVMTLLLTGIARTQGVDVPKPSGNLNINIGIPPAFAA
ncbi:MAG TPA: hypothetical protein VGW77_31710 [Candidatus Binatia bacterium]|jgi:hypothetical protein|nr:hypothetical protein [Candidatus Binatia bacterium]